MITFPAKLQIVKTWKVQSKSRKSVKHIVNLWNDDTWDCDCESYRECSHIQEKRSEIEKEKLRNCDEIDKINLELTDYDHSFSSSN